MPFTGEVKATVGGVVSDVGITTVTLTDALVVFPAASRAIAEIVWLPAESVAAFNEAVYGAAVISAPTFKPSTLNCTPAPPELSVAVAARVIIPVREAPFVG